MLRSRKLPQEAPAHESDYLASWTSEVERRPSIATLTRDGSTGGGGGGSGGGSGQQRRGQNVTSQRWKSAGGSTCNRKKRRRNVLTRSAFRLPPDQKFRVEKNKSATGHNAMQNARPSTSLVVTLCSTSFFFLKTKIFFFKKWQRTSPEQSSCGRMGGIVLRIPNKF